MRNKRGHFNKTNSSDYIENDKKNVSTDKENNSNVYSAVDSDYREEKVDKYFLCTIVHDIQVHNRNIRTHSLLNKTALNTFCWC